MGPDVAEVRADVDPGLAGRRVAVRNPRGRATQPAPGERARAELAEQTEVGEVLLRSLTRAQLMLAVRIFAVFGFFLLGLPALFATHPDLADFRVFGLPLPWLVLGGAVYPLLVLLALLYVRQAERNERDFVEFVERS
jgi:putative solute:sodium symporter small subunit